MSKDPTGWREGPGATPATTRLPTPGCRPGGMVLTSGLFWKLSVFLPKLLLCPAPTACVFASSPLPGKTSNSRYQRHRLFLFKRQPSISCRRPSRAPCRPDPLTRHSPSVPLASPAPQPLTAEKGASGTAAGALLPGSRASSRDSREGLASRVTLLGSANPRPLGAQLQKMGPAVPGPRTSRVLRVRMDVGLQL